MTFIFVSSYYDYKLYGRGQKCDIWTDSGEIETIAKEESETIAKYLCNWLSLTMILIR